MSRFHIEADYAALHSSFPTHKRRPIIGITGNYDTGKCTLLEGYYRSVLEAGGTPLIIPPCDDTDAMVSLLDRVDALILSGGGDINPLYLGEEPMRELSSINPARDWHELMLVRLAANRQIPILGICRGLQVMTAALGGKLYQDIYELILDAIAEEKSQNEPNIYELEAQYTTLSILILSWANLLSSDDKAFALDLLKKYSNAPRVTKMNEKNGLPFA